MDHAFIPCTTMYLPSEMQVAAAEEAVRQNPANRPANAPAAAGNLILPPEQLAVLTSRYWGSKGVKLTVSFLEPAPDDLKKRILSHANAWGTYGNVNFVLVDSDGQVRITRSLSGYWSYLGTDILSIPKNEPTMCLQAFTMQTHESEFKRVVRHEVGHTCGFVHEHLRSAIIRRLDPEKTIAYFRRTQGWSSAMTQQQVLTPLAESSIMASPDADEASIMTYSLPGIITRDGQPILGGSDIEDQDAAFVASIYPKAVAPPPPVMTGLDLSMDFARKVLTLNLPAGWTVGKKSKSSEETQTMDFTTLANELEATIPTTDIGVAAAQGGIISAVLNLITALRAGDVKGIAVALRDLLNILLAGVDGTEISFQQLAAAARIDWKRLIGVLVKILPLILGV